MGYWIAGAGWLIVSIHYYGNTSIYIASTIIFLMAVLLSVTFIAPISSLKLINSMGNKFMLIAIFSSILTLIELLRFILLGGFPWLLPGLVLMDTISQDIIPILGVYGGSFMVYFIASFLALFFYYQKFKLVIFGFFFLIIFYPHQGYKPNDSENSLTVSIIQPALEPENKYQEYARENIEETLLQLSKEASTSDLLIWPESPLPYLQSSSDMEHLYSRTAELPIILSGGWSFNEGQLHNVMTVLGTDQTYIKRHLVLFGEYIPFESILRGLIQFFDMPMSSISPGPNNQELLTINNYQILGLICFDVAFPLSFLNKVKGANFIINISNDTWFGSSYGPYQHLQIVRARALEFNKWIARGTSDGISTIVDNKGTIVSKLGKGISGSLNGKIYITESSSFFTNFGFIIVPILSFILLMMSLALRLRQ